MPFGADLISEDKRYRLLMRRHKNQPAHVNADTTMSDKTKPTSIFRSAILSAPSAPNNFDNQSQKASGKSGMNSEPGEVSHQRVSNTEVTISHSPKRMPRSAFFIAPTPCRKSPRFKERNALALTITISNANFAQLGSPWEKTVNTACQTFA